MQPLSHLSESNARLGPTGLKVAIRILERWKCTPEEQQAILGLARATYYKYKKNPESARLDRDQLDRVSYVLNIHAALNTVFENPANRYGFMRMRNHNPYFSGKAPIEIVSQGSMASLYETFKRIDAMRGAQW